MDWDMMLLRRVPPLEDRLQFLAPPTGDQQLPGAMRNPPNHVLWRKLIADMCVFSSLCLSLSLLSPCYAKPISHCVDDCSERTMRDQADSPPNLLSSALRFLDFEVLSLPMLSSHRLTAPL